jgi:DNA replication and repair protein RecF
MKKACGKYPILLLDDIFDKLDAKRVERIVKLVSTERFGQIFITDTNREHLDTLLQQVEGEKMLFTIYQGGIK